MLRAVALSLTATLTSAFVANVVDYGALGDGSTMNTDAFHKASSAVEAAGGGVLLVPEGRFLTGAFNLTSNCRLEVQGHLVGAADITQYPVIPPLPSYGVSRDVGVNRYQALIMAYMAKNVSVVGPGVVDGNGSYWWDLHHENKLVNGRPRMMEFYNCSRVEVAGVMLQDSGFWTVHPVYCKDFWMQHVTVVAPSTSPNTDGVDPDSTENALVEYCDIGCGDDVVAIKSGIDQYGRMVGMPCKNVTIRHNTFRSGHGVSIGSEVSGGIQDVYIYNNTCVGPLESGARIKTAPSRGGYIRNINFYDNTYGTVTEITNLQTDYSSGPAYYPLTDIRDITYSNLSRTPGSTFEAKPGIWSCFADAPCDNISLTHVHLEPVSGKWSCAHMVNTTVKDVTPAGLTDCSENQL